MYCPTCQAKLHKEKFEGVEIDHCLTCGGVWLDHGELDRLVDRRDRLVEFTSVDHDSGIHGDNHPKRHCPHCNKVMKKVDLLEENSGIIYDYCPACEGFWLDQGEIARTKQYLKEKGKGITNFVRSLTYMLGVAGPSPRPF